MKKRRASTPILHAGSKFRHGLLQLMIHSIDPLHDGKVTLLILINSLSHQPLSHFLRRLRRHVATRFEKHTNSPVSRKIVQTRGRVPTR
ncbi:hypothetical protein AVEN_45475-1 [Araneus ventricosus]|uniref:Uncharacterized protein n=1 Tax=Araneus ventricosus TaxID=182803 RepID=A0A4Y2PJ21_ARAVE|nr:hypothetical protein AVEN_45475-1 [Araneus ventricosus]